MPTDKSASTEKGQLSRARILETALDLFAHRGYHNTSVNLIAKEAGVSKGLIFNYFKNKEDLLMGILYMGMETLDPFTDEINKISDPRGKLLALVDLSFKSMKEDHEQYKLMTSLSLQLDEFPAISEMVKAKYSGMLQMMGHLFEEMGVEDPMEAYLFGTFLDGVGMQYIILGELVPLDEIKAYLIKKYKLDTK